MSKHDETLFSWIKKLIGKLFTMAVCGVATMVFLGTFNSNAVVALVAGAVAFLSFCAIFTSDED